MSFKYIAHYRLKQNVTSHKLYTLSPLSRIALASFVALLVLLRFVGFTDHENTIEGLISIVLKVVAISVFIFILYKDQKKYGETKNRLDLLPTIIGILTILILIGDAYRLKLKDSSPAKIECTGVNGIADYTIYFRNDGTYKLTVHDIEQVDHYRGKYTIKDSTITLDHAPVGTAIMSNKLVITRKRMADTDSVITAVCQADSSGKVIADATYFSVTQ